MTIDIGFAHLNKSISLIDVPGHERFIKNMVSGVSSIDFAILVIAADDGIMPQTLEHLEILQLLNIKNGLIILNKIDLVEKEWLELVELEIKESVKGTFLERCEIIKTSTLTGSGIDLLKDKLVNLEPKSVFKFKRDIFRMFIDRVFSIKGFGTIVTGTVSSGILKKGEILELLPICKEVKIRGLQSHDTDVNSVNLGSRAAINLHSNDKIELKRGSHLAIKNFFTTTNIAAVSLHILLKSKIKKIKHNQRIRFHLGTQETIGRILLVDKSLKSNFPAIIKFEKNIIASFKDRFIIRSFSPISTICGGEVLDTNISGKWNKIKLYTKKLFNNQIEDYQLIKIILENDYNTIYTHKSLSQKLGISEKLLIDYLSESNDIEYIGSNNKCILSFKQYNSINHAIINFLTKGHKKSQYRNGFLKEEINEIFEFNLDFLENILSLLCKKEKIKLKNDLYSIFDFTIKLPAEEVEATNKLLEIIDREGFNSSNISELVKVINQTEETIKRLLKIESNNKNIIILNKNVFFTKENFDKMVKKVINHFDKFETMNIKQFKEIADTTRKYAVPLLEYLDKIKITYRIGNERKINK